MYCSCRHRIVQACAVAEKNVQPPVIVIIKYGHAGAHCFQEILLGRRRGAVTKGHAKLLRRIAETACAYRLRRRSLLPCDLEISHGSENQANREELDRKVSHLGRTEE